MKELLFKLICQLLAMKLTYHNSHHVCGKVAFFSDHEAFGSFYSQLDSDYDDASERFVGMFDQMDLFLPNIIAQAHQRIQGFPSSKAPDNSALFSYALKAEQELLMAVEQICKLPECRESDKQLISEIGNKAQSRIYKIKQRCKK